MDAAVQALIEELSRDLVALGAKATLVTGSQARGRAGPHSDIDIFVVGEGPHEWFEKRGDRLVSIHWWTPEQARQRMSNPATAFVAALGWRDAVIIDDPTGIGAELQREAQDWTWEKLDREADSWVAEQLTGWAEYVQKLIGALDSGRELDAAALRSQLVIRLCEVLAVHRRLTSESENGLWETIADAGGPDWRAALESAFGVKGGDSREAAAGAMRLFAVLADDADRLLDERQRTVVRHVLAATDQSPSRAA